MLNSLAREFVAASPRALQFAVIIPTLNEYDNIVPLLERLSIALSDFEWEAIFVDDGSIDGTTELLRHISIDNRHVRLVQRVGRRGLSSAVIEGMLASTAPLLGVIDADLQHDETILPDLIRALEQGFDLAIGSRYTAGGSIGMWQASRARGSLVATRMAGLVLRTPISDPMSGFFAIRREALMAAIPHLSAVGYKILLDLVSSSPQPPRIREIPYTFRSRHAGESKLDATILLEYSLLLIDKIVGRWLPIRFVMFLCVGAIGVIVNLIVLGLLLHLGLSFASAQIGAVILSMTFNFVLNNQFTYRDRRLVGRRLIAGLASFYVVCGLGAIANVGVGTLVYGNDHRWWVAGLAGAVIGSVWNYAATQAFTWKKR